MNWRTGNFVLLITVAFSAALQGCGNRSEKDRQAAVAHCSSCHAFPEAGLLDKKTWRESVLPQMAFRMGFRNMEILSSIPPEDLNTVIGTLPVSRTVTQQDWDALSRYYQNMAPDSLTSIPLTTDPLLARFDASTYPIAGSGYPVHPMVQVLPERGKLFISGIAPSLYQLDANMAVEDSFRLSSAVSFLKTERPNSLLLCLIGDVGPHDTARGKIVRFDPLTGRVETILDSLQRPVYFEKTDINEDGFDDFVVCCYGNYTGALLVFENLRNGKFRKHTMLERAGARKVVVRDFNGDGKKDVMVLMAQGNEQIILFTGLADFRFDSKVLLTFPSVYGSAYFEVIDWNHDGHPDILYTNGDNLDFTRILKPYHGIRLFVNDGHFNFTQGWFLHMDGAVKALAFDADSDGDLDICAISGFPDFFRHPENGFVYFENLQGRFIAHVTALASRGRWFVMDNADIDNDGDIDIVAGAIDYTAGVPAGLATRWKKDKYALLVLRNTLHRPQTAAAVRLK